MQSVTELHDAFYCVTSLACASDGVLLQQPFEEMNVSLHCTACGFRWASFP